MKKTITIIAMLISATLSAQEFQNEADLIYLTFSKEITNTKIKKITKSKKSAAYYFKLPSYYNFEHFKRKVRMFAEQYTDVELLSNWEIKKKGLFTVSYAVDKSRILIIRYSTKNIGMIIYGKP